MLGPVAPPAGGVQSHVSSLTERLRSAGHRVSVVAITRSTEQQAQADVYHPVGAVDLLRRLRALRPELIHVHLGGDFTGRLAMLCAVVALMPGVRSVLTFHSGGFPASAKGQRASPRSLEGIALRRLDAVIAVNDEIAMLFQRYGVARHRISTIAPFARIDRSRIASTLPPAMAEFFSRHSPVLLSVGMLEPEYSLELQIDALSTLRQSHPDAGLLMIGSGSLEQSLRDRIAASPVGAHVALQGNVEHSTTLRAIDEADVLLRTTRYDGDAVSVREALQLGTPVVASATALRPAGVFLMANLDAAGLVECCLRAIPTSASVPHHGVTRPIEDELARVEDLYTRLLQQ